jgi:hypothetical protein
MVACTCNSSTCWIPSQWELPCPARVDILASWHLHGCKGRHHFRLTNTRGREHGVSPDGSVGRVAGGSAQKGRIYCKGGAAGFKVVSNIRSSLSASSSSSCMHFSIDLWESLHHEFGSFPTGILIMQNHKRLTYGISSQLPDFWQNNSKCKLIWKFSDQVGGHFFASRAYLSHLVSQ